MRDALLLGIIVVSLLATLRYPFVGILLWAWFVIMNPHQMAYGVYGLQLNVIIAAVTLVSLIVHGEFRRFALDRLTTLLLLFAFWLTVSQAFSLDPASSAVYYDRFIKLLVFVALCAQMTTSKLRFHALLWMLVIGVGFFALKGAAFTIVTLGQFRVQGPVNTIMEDNNHIGIIMATILPLILYLRAQAAARIVKTGLLVLFAATVLAILGTQSRGAFVALLVFASFFWLRSRRKLSILVALAVLLLPAIAFMPAKWKERMETIAEATADASFMGRVDAWIINTEIAVAHPLTGAGLRNPYLPKIAASVDPARAASAKAAHSIYFEVLGGSGFVGLGLYLALLATAFFTALSLHRRAREPSAQPWSSRFGYFAQMALVVFGVGGATVSLEMWDGYLIIVALVAAAARLARAPAPAAAHGEIVAKLRWRVAARGRSTNARPRSA
ncbi:MAG: putative O-glycosylation ligase, exosortase A system-associated [Parvularculaceae bacterium]